MTDFDYMRCLVLSVCNSGPLYVLTYRSMSELFYAANSYRQDKFPVYSVREPPFVARDCKKSALKYSDHSLLQ
jgi:hypothetical protein